MVIVEFKSIEAFWKFNKVLNKGRITDELRSTAYLESRNDKEVMCRVLVGGGDEEKVMELLEEYGGSVRN